MNKEGKYNAALKRARDLMKNQNPPAFDKHLIETVFPELKEDKDERIRKTIYGWIYTQPSEFFDNGFSKEEMLAWLEKQGKQKQTWEPNAAQLIVIKDLIEDKNTSKVNKVVLRGMLDELKQFKDSQSSQFSSGHLLDPDKVIDEHVPTKFEDMQNYVHQFKKDFEL